MQKMAVALIMVAVILPFSCTGEKESGDPSSDSGMTETRLPEEGTFKAEDEFDSRGWKGKVTIVVENNNITEVEYSEINKDGQTKAENTEYAERMKPVTGTTPAEAVGKLESRLVAANNIAEVEAVSGATATSTRFFKLARKALTQ